MSDTYSAVVGAGTLRSTDAAAVSFPHRWTPEGVTVLASFTGAHLLHLSIAGCVLNDLYREAAALGIDLDGVRVTAEGAFDLENWASTGVSYTVELSTTATAEVQAHLLSVVDGLAEIPRALRQGAGVTRRH